MFLLLMILVLSAITVSTEKSSACARMDVPVLQKISQGLCTASCASQKCLSGKCKKMDSRPTCFCGGCSPTNSDDVSLDVLISKLPHKP